MFLPRLFVAKKVREAPVRLRCGGGRVRAVPVFGSCGSSAKRVFLCFSKFLKGKDGFGFRKTVPAVLVPFSVSGSTVLTVPVSGSGSVPEPPWRCIVVVLIRPGPLGKLFRRDLAGMDAGTGLRVMWGCVCVWGGVHARNRHDLANWRSHSRMEHFFGQKYEIFGRFALRFQ